jgi:hypothetical protein
MVDHVEKQKKTEEKIERALEELVEATSKHPAESKEVEVAKIRRALAEKELVDSRAEKPK